MMGFEPTRPVRDTDIQRRRVCQFRPQGPQRGGDPTASPFPFSVAAFSFDFGYQRPARFQITFAMRNRRKLVRTVRSLIDPS